MSHINRFKVVLVGDAGSGKTTFVHSHLTGKFLTRYTPTLGVDVHPLVFNTNYGHILFDLWDTAGQEKYTMLREGYAVGAQAIIGFFDINSKVTLSNLNSWLRFKEYAHLPGSVPSVVCGNKCDIPEHKVKMKDKQALLDTWDTYFDVSAKSKHNYEKPFLYLARRLTGHDDLEFVNK